MTIVRTLVLGAAILIAGCGAADRQTGGDNKTSDASGQLLVVASNYPLYFFATRIADGIDARPEIVLPAIEGDPAHWIPNAEQIQLLQVADIVLINGAGAESWLNLITLDPRRLVDTSANIADRLIPLEDSVLHQHGPAGEHSHEGTAFTTWLDPGLAIAQAQAVTNALIELAPTGESQFRDNMSQLEQKLMALDAQFTEVFARLDGRPVLFSHPVYQYLQRRYGINGESVHWEPFDEPTTSAWIELQQLISTHRATIMIWEDEPLGSSKSRLAEVGIESIPFHTSANQPDEEDYLSVMQANAERIAASL